MQLLGSLTLLREIDTAMVNSYSSDCLKVLEHLTYFKNVLISGPPGTGKSRLLSEVALAFEALYGARSNDGPAKLDVDGEIPIPQNTGASKTSVSSGNLEKKTPAWFKSNRKVFRTVFHQNSRYRDFVSGITPSINTGGEKPSFVVVSGTLYRASEHAKSTDGAALLIIDEINRGPAVQVFGGAIVSMESDKRLAVDGTIRPETQFFELLDPVNGDIVEYALPHDLYILAAMNQADASVEPLDVAFLRRWEPFRLEPDVDILRNHYGHSSTEYSLPKIPSNNADYLEASVKAWAEINKQIALGRGREFQIGHGVLMSSNGDMRSMQQEELLDFLCVAWERVRAHVEETFFGDLRGIAATFNAIDGPSHNPFKLVETTFADSLRYMLDGPTAFTKDMIYDALRAFARE